MGRIKVIVGTFLQLFVMFGVMSLLYRAFYVDIGTLHSSRWRVQNAGETRKDTEVRQIRALKMSNFVPAGLVYSEPGVITLGMILSEQFTQNSVEDVMNSLFSYTSQTSLHFVIMTRSSYLRFSSKKIALIITKMITMRIILTR